MNEQELINYYNKFNEDKRLNTKHAQVEFLTAMKYIKDYLKKGDKILDIGAGCGKYSITLSEMGYDVTAIELVKHNLRVIQKKSDKVKAFLGNALDLSRFDDDSFDVTLLFGPMYHLISKEDIKVWGHTTKSLNGEIHVTSLNSVEFQVNKYKPYNYVEVRLAMPTYLFDDDESKINTNKLESIVEEEKNWARAN